LIKVYLDKGSQSDFHPPGFVYMSPGALEHHGMLIVLIQDKGTIRCGVWSWRAVANEGLERGSQIPYVRWALGESCAVLLMNPNEGAMAPEEHVQQVWDQLLLNSTAEQITVVAHGYGGLAFVQLLNRLVGYLKVGCRMMSAGTQCHETAPATCMDSVFRFIAKLMKPAVMPTPFCIVTRSRSLGVRKLSGITDRNNNAS
ncbi:cotranscriptional regulator FAM172A homolog, partial [Ictalurus furcatus]|uniref:cotranscriptional regulator FAM172A homolog n=1 Tax=Ictalurus furcatus TaxID=66913 RepID=UPI002350E4A1